MSALLEAVDTEDSNGTREFKKTYLRLRLNVRAYSRVSVMCDATEVAEFNTGDLQRTATNLVVSLASSTRKSYGTGRVLRQGMLMCCVVDRRTVVEGLTGLRHGHPMEMS